MTEKEQMINKLLFQWFNMKNYLKTINPLEWKKTSHMGAKKAHAIN